MDEQCHLPIILMIFCGMITLADALFALIYEQHYKYLHENQQRFITEYSIQIILLDI